MPRVKLAHWHSGNPPGAEIDVTDQQLADLRRDGRVAEVLATATEPSSAEQQDQATQPEPPSEAEPASEAPEAAPAPRPRKR
ncbi:hypothetical protein ACIPSJ_01465 [Streptomyces sp. NPDC090088]|uniref:hypothetical protein n=1 Tax=Streptomyces sp. NPDC090088 TaxID=3365944 RepID=UPI0038126AB1